MLTTTRLPGTDLVEIHYDGELTDEARRGLHQLLDEVVEEQGRVRLLAAYENVDRAQPSALWEDLRMQRLTPVITKMAVLTDRRWFAAVTRLVDAVGVLDCRTFAPDEHEQALAWLQGQEPERGPVR
jgi:hypothetical protein